MGKTRGKELKIGKKSVSSRSIIKADIHLKNTVGKISADISAISLGPPRTKILKKTGISGSSSNFASRLKAVHKQKKKVTFCQNLIAEELKEQKRSAEGEDAKNYFKVIHPSAIRKFAKIESLKKKKITDPTITDPNILKSSTAPQLRKMIKTSVKNKKIRLKARKETFKKKMELIKTTGDEFKKAKQRQQAVIVGDMHPMLEALPSLPMNDEDDNAVKQTDLIMNVGEGRKCIPKKVKFSVKKTQQAILDSLKFFEVAGVAASLSKN